jgi:hypothetical protein
MRRYLNLLVILLLAGIAFGQQEIRVPGPQQPPDPKLSFTTSTDVPVSVPLPKMTPELTLAMFMQRQQQQANDLTGYSAEMVISAELPDTQQKGEYEVTRTYEAPATLKFKGVKFTGDSFVKTNVITRVLQSEVDHTAPEKMAESALNSDNYKFSYKGDGEIMGRAVHEWAVKPRHKRAGLFKGHIYLDATTGTLVRAEGEVPKSPSVFVKKIEFMEDFTDIGSFTFPVRLHSTAKARIIGRTVLDISTTNYAPTRAEKTASTAGSTVSTTAN